LFTGHPVHSRAATHVQPKQSLQGTHDHFQQQDISHSPGIVTVGNDAGHCFATTDGDAVDFGGHRQVFAAESIFLFVGQHVQLFGIPAVVVVVVVGLRD